VSIVERVLCVQYEWSFVSRMSAPVEFGTEATTRANGRRAFYICHRRRHHGTACTNTLRIPLSDMNDAVLQAIEAHALTPEAVEQVIALTERDDVRDRQEALRHERKDVEKR
jgi:hypothetical protein